MSTSPKTIFTLTASIAFVLALMTTAVTTLEAAMPSSKTIVSRLARNSGRGVYVVEQEVRFAGPEGIVLKERWLIQNGDVMRLIVQSNGQAGPDGKPTAAARWDALYRDGRRTATVPAAPVPATAPPGTIGEPGKDLKTIATSAEFFEPYLYQRYSARYFDAFVKNKILPPSAAHEKPRIANIATYKPTPEPGVRLGRSGGTVAWVFGEPTPVDNATQYPGAWIEQDTFVLKKLRLLSQSEMVLSDHANSGAGLKLARERSIVWKSSDPNVLEPRSATIKVLSVKNLPDKSLAPQFQASSISSSEIKAARLPDVAAVREFYARFR